MRFHRRDAAVTNAATRNDGQAVQRHPFARNNLTTRAIPLRLEIVSRSDVARCRFNPVGIDSRQRAREQPRGLSKLSSDQPFQTLLIHAAAGKRIELDASCAEKMFTVIGLHANVAE